ncbi:MAG TPA: nicotinate (nicotinamide) nucleotide adenylyltransferase [Bacteroidales bacterium]|jgi:nicotinate-nucleotide adenylyltransferase|nr:nicotinate-nucleotide adenylyltransferase [Bacteroidales bacterium]MDI9574615.1 nicotinate (nicotinamide) nucleotide adenylyltransferase [Bacteroidota bacterium]OQC59516.1 MAG: Nicotinate-nucleotide adenylyltransferase [Bacteroidetes bacterium ADurb.Bin012]MBP9512109.1 nicotinate-nucleotide adenylyltransferase [Bacteroidales bacterium]MBP9588652.1 nicotinate-nucleotide adenylyltransferase [Bacteroidales bacterium]
MKNNNNKTGLFFGSFNPIHNGHLMIANYLVEYTDLKQIIFVVSPRNPLKEKELLAEDRHRLRMVELAIQDDRRFSASDIEFHLPTPSYTVHTLEYLRQIYPQERFVLVIGGDNLQYFDRWKDPELILEKHEIYVYCRLGFEGGKFANHTSVKIIASPLIDISSSMIRQAYAQGKDLRYFQPLTVYEYIRKFNIY